jgi:hypothetical protein
MYRLDLGSLRELARKRITRGFRPEECKDHFGWEWVCPSLP